MTIHMPVLVFWVLGPIAVVLCAIGLANVILLFANHLWRGRRW